MARESCRLTDVDVDFLAVAAATQIGEKAGLKQSMEASEDSPEAFHADGKTERKEMTDKESVASGANFTPQRRKGGDSIRK